MPVCKDLNNAMTERYTHDGNWIPSVRALRSKYYATYSPDLFATLVLQNVHPSDQVLEVGAGTGRNHQNHFELRGKVSRYVGVDPDPGVLSNPFLDEAYQASAESLPFANETFDLVFHNYVAEHFEFPLACNCEISRVLKPRGLLMFQTPSRYYYACAAARMTPHWFHEFYIQRFGSGRTEKEVFPVFYRLNDAKSIETQLHACGFQTEIQHHSIPPGYLRFSKLAFLAGILYERTLERSFPGLRGAIIVTARKQPTAGPRACG
jgi:SAM-dependent methyltransferase